MGEIGIQNDFEKIKKYQQIVVDGMEWANKEGLEGKNIFADKK